MALGSKHTPRKRLPVFFTWGCSSLLCVFVLGCVQENEPIVAGTALIQCAVQDLIPGAAVPLTLIPPGSCPGHYDMRPGDIQRVAACDTLLIHPWQETLANVAGVVRASGIPRDKVLVVPVPGNWMAPDAYAEALESLAEILVTKGMGPEGLSDRAEQRGNEVRSLGRKLQDRLRTAGAPNTAVMCQDMIQPFVEWAGFAVAGPFGRSEDLSAGDVEALVRLGKEQGVTLVIDNLQSGDEKMGETLARELGADRVAISNFPGGLPNTATWERALTRNVELLLGVLERLGAPAM